MSDRTNKFLATALGFGLSPIAPGTFGTLPAVAFFVIVALIRPAGDAVFLVILAVALAVSCAVSITLSPWAIRYWKTKDPKHFVLDEVAGILLTVLIFPGLLMLWDLALPLEDSRVLLLTALWAFLAFRLFDITKLPPVSHAESLPGGWGILCDDLVASLYAGGLLHVLYYLFPAMFGVA